jgi:hypothetical protein
MSLCWLSTYVTKLWIPNCCVSSCCVEHLNDEEAMNLALRTIDIYKNNLSGMAPEYRLRFAHRILQGLSLKGNSEATYQLAYQFYKCRTFYLANYVGGSYLNDPHYNKKCKELFKLATQQGHKKAEEGLKEFEDYISRRDQEDRRLWKSRFAEEEKKKEKEREHERLMQTDPHYAQQERQNRLLEKVAAGQKELQGQLESLDRRVR